MYTILGRPNCHWCDKAKELLDKHQIKYEYICLMEDQELREVMIKQGHKTVPIIFDVDDELIGGYTELEALLSKG